MKSVRHSQVFFVEKQINLLNLLKNSEEEILKQHFQSSHFLEKKILMVTSSIATSLIELTLALFSSDVIIWGVPNCAGGNDGDDKNIQTGCPKNPLDSSRTF